MLIQNALPSEFDELGKLIVETYAQLEGFPKPHKQPKYYSMLATIGDFLKKV